MRKFAQFRLMFGALIYCQAIRQGSQLGVVRKKLGVVQKFNVVRTGLTARGGHGKTRRGQKVQRGHNLSDRGVRCRLPLWRCARQSRSDSGDNAIPLVGYDPMDEPKESDAACRGFPQQKDPQPGPLLLSIQSPCHLLQGRLSCLRNTLVHGVP